MLINKPWTDLKQMDLKVELVKDVWEVEFILMRQTLAQPWLEP